MQDNASKDAYTYDNANRLLTVNDSGTTGLPQVTLTYGYDPAGNRTSLDDSKDGLTSYTYDVRNELVTLTLLGHRGDRRAGRLRLRRRPADDHADPLLRPGGARRW